MNCKRLIALCCVFVIGFSVFTPARGMAEVKITQEIATKKIKDLFDTAAFDVFNINFSENPERTVWRLNWSMSKEPYESLSATVNATSGDILDFYMYKGYDPDKKASPIPLLKEEQAKKLAGDFIRALQPQEFSASEFIEEPSQDYRPLQQINYIVDYTFRYQRMEKGIPVEGDGFLATVDADTGEVLRYRFNWTTAALPDSKDIIPLEKADEVFRKEKGLELIYNRYYDYRSKEEDIKLVYRVKNPGLLIDALTGEIVEGYGNIIFYEMSKDAAPAAGEGGFSPAEQAEIDASKNCITKEAAVKSVKNYFEIPASYRLSNAGLYEVYMPHQRVWNLSWDKGEKDKNDGYGSIYARVDAVTSEILSYSSYDDERYTKDFKPNYDMDAAKKKGEELLKSIQPLRFDLVKFDEEPKNMQTPDNVREYNFNYTRQVNDIPFPADGFSVRIDSVTGKAVSFDMNWRDTDFISPQEIISRENAGYMFNEKVGFKLSYEGIYNPKTSGTEYKLVYKLNSADSYTFDAFDFNPLDYSGKPIIKQNPTVFSDIKGHWAEGNIKLLVDLGVIASEEDTFKPDNQIVMRDFVKLLMIAKGQRPAEDLTPIPREGASSSDEETGKYFAAAQKLGWIKDGEFSADASTPREHGAALLIRAQGYEKIASLSNIYQVRAKDAFEVSKQYNGHVAISMELGLLGKQNDNFRPKAPLTRAEAATIIVRLLSL